MRSININSADGVSIDVNKYNNTSAPSQGEIWTRPSDWLPLPEVDGSQQIFAVLFAVDNTTYNRAAFGIDDNVIINWGDGSIQNYSGGVEATHDYVFSSIPSSTQTKEGYRQVIITITPQAGNNLTAIYGNSTIDSGSLEVVASGPLLFADYLNSMDRVQHAKMLCKINFVAFCASLVYLEFGYESPTVASFSYCPNLKYISNFDTTQLEASFCSFTGCSSLINLPDIDYSNFNDFNYAFSGCTALTTTPLIVFTGFPPARECFSGCVNLYKANLTGAVSDMTAMFGFCTNLLEFPALDLSVAFGGEGGQLTIGFTYSIRGETREFKAFGMKNTLEFTGEDIEPIGQQRFTRSTLIEIMTNLGLANAGAKLRISGCIGFSELTNGDKAIATNKGWTIT
jgi:hypothetical protein